MLLKSRIENLKTIIKPNNVLLKTEERYCYAEDSTNTSEFIGLPDAVVFVETIEDVQKIVKYASKNNLPIISRGAGTNMVGACTCPKGGIVLNFSKMNKVLDFNAEDMTMSVEPGVTLGKIKDLASKENLFYPPDPSNYKVSTIGGSIALSSGGAKAFKYGTTKDYILSLKVVMADGSVVTFGSGTIKDAVGYHLNQLMIGSEGTLGIVVEAKLKLIPKPESTRVIMAYFDTIENATSGVSSILKNKVFPSTIDFMDKDSMQTVEAFCPCGLHTEKEAVLLVEIDGFESSMATQQNLVTKALNEAGASNISIATTENEIEAIWTARRSSYAATAKLAPDVVSDDIIVPRSKISEMVNGCRNICKKYNLKTCIVGHLGDGNIHPQVALNLENDDEFKNYISAKTEMYELATSLGGTISSEHGVGIEKISYIENTIDKNAINYMRYIKNVFDPKNILNPEKIFKM